MGIKVEGINPEGTDIVIVSGKKDTLGVDSLSEFEKARAEAEAAGIVTEGLAQNFFNIFGLAIPKDMIGIRYALLNGTNFDPTQIKRKE